LVIVISIGVPSFQSAINGTRLSSAANELSAAVQVARAEAVRRNRSVVLCRSDNLTACADGATWSGWLVFVDTNADGVVDAGEEILKTGTVGEPLVMRASPAVSSRSQIISFLPSGMARGADETALLNAALSVCAASTQPENNVRDVLIAFGSRTSVRSRNTGGVCAAAPADT
jgi:type IV fimbrial biogenesis protein FimT